MTAETDSHAQRPVAIWLFVCAAMVVAMMAIGAITRLTESGLSMVEWRPLIGVWPPTGEAEWNRVFALYRQTSEYRLVNSDMNLGEFQTIFWWEFIHRLWGRSIGLVFAIPFVVFLVQRRIPRRLVPHLAGLFLLGAAQGVIGWWMVRSGFVDRTDVSQYRLAIHLGMAFLILGYLLWLALGLVARPSSAPASAGLRRLATLTLGAVAATALAGGLVAGLDAGLDYNTWPLMDGGLAPDGALALSPWWLNAFENAATVQFDHRMLAYFTAFCVAWLWLRARRERVGGTARIAVNALAAMVAVQLTLGIATLLLAVPLALGVAHQMGAATLFVLALWSQYALGGHAAATECRPEAPPRSPAAPA